MHAADGMREPQGPALVMEGADSYGKMDEAPRASARPAEEKMGPVAKRFTTRPFAQTPTRGAAAG